MYSMTDAYLEIFSSKKRVMVIMAHPDDAEIFAGGTIARLTDDGKEVRVVKMTSGNKGSRQNEISESELSKLRNKEDAEAAAALGIKPENNIHLDFGDGEVENSLATIEKLVYQIRQFKPELIIAHNPEHVVIRFDKDNSWVNHRDHRNSGQSAIDAGYPYSRDILFFPEQLKEPGLTSHAVSEFLLVDYWDHPDIVGININDFVAKRVEAMVCHASQYSKEEAQSSTDFFNKQPDGHYFERFRYVKAD